MHELENDLVEIAEVNWQISLLYERTKRSWATLWAAREPLPWPKCRTTDIENSLPLRNFVFVLDKARKNPGRHWQSEDELVESMEQHLLTSQRIFLEVGLLNLAERAHRKLIEILLTSSKVKRSVGQYAEFSSKLGGISDTSLAVGLGLYYRVWYLGTNMPEYLRSKEFIYRNSKSLHLSDFAKSLHDQLTALVVGIKVNTMLDSSKIPGTYITSDLRIFVNRL
jgi:hypothetical protein